MSTAFYLLQLFVSKMAGNNSTKSLLNTSCIFRSPFQVRLRLGNVLALCIVNVIFALSGAFLNSVVIYVFVSSSLLRKHVSYFLIMVLSCIGLVVVVGVYPLAILYSINELTGHHICINVNYFKYSIIFYVVYQLIHC